MKRKEEWKKIYHSPDFTRDYLYEGKDLGAVCTEEGSSFLLWSPFADRVTLRLYKDGNTSPCLRQLPMQKEDKGVWALRTPENLHGMYYDFSMEMDGETTVFADPYARACGVNGIRSMAVTLSETDPDGWNQDCAPQKPVENIIYELHIKEFSWDKSGGFPEKTRGKYTAFSCEHTTLGGDGVHPTGLDYLKDLGVTYVQLMPAYDYGSVDETDGHAFNWGYDPVNYNVPEGSYSTDPYHGQVRIREFKEMIQSLHRQGFRVIMDVVYNHMYSLDSNLNRAVPWYYFRTYENGEISNGSACGNDVASERPMCASYILDSVLYWAEEYHIDGFRFDLMGLLDVPLMNRIRQALDLRYGKGEKLVFGEPWAAAATAMEGGALPALKANLQAFDENVGIFCDDTRDAIKGHVFEGEVPGFVNGMPGLEEKILHSVTAWCSEGSPVKAPSQILSYVSAHDNWTLWDKLALTMPNTDEEELLRVNKLAAAIYMTCQGSIFFLSGEEFARTKDGEENSFNLPIELNRLDWIRSCRYQELYRYYKGLIALRKASPGLCDKSADAHKRIYGQWKKENAVGFFVNNQGNGAEAPWKTLYIIYNASRQPLKLPLPEGSWQVLADGFSSQRRRKADKCMEIPAQSALILGQG